MEFLLDYGLFAAKVLTVVVIFAIAAGALIILILSRSHSRHDEQIEVKNLNDKFTAMRLTLQASMLTPKAFKEETKKNKADRKARDKSPTGENERPRIFVCRFEGDLRASAVSALREEVTAILSVAKKSDEVVAIIGSPGGVVHGYGLAASQLRRLREHGIPLTAIVDKVAASGGYMMACVADHVIAAPFAIIGSIGVVAQMPNFNRFLKKHNIDFEEITAGKYKRTLTMFGENTDEDREKFREELEEAHELFKEFVATHRPQVDIDTIATGEYWYGTRALELKLIDKLQTSDDYLFERANEADIFEIKVTQKKNVLEKFFEQGARLFDTGS